MLQFTPIMPVPKMSQLKPGVGVNVVLKVDQRSGRLTSGSISEVSYSEPLCRTSWKTSSKSKVFLIPFRAVSLLGSFTLENGFLMSSLDLDLW